RRGLEQRVRQGHEQQAHQQQEKSDENRVNLENSPVDQRQTSEFFAPMKSRRDEEVQNEQPQQRETGETQQCDEQHVKLQSAKGREAEYRHENSEDDAQRVIAVQQQPVLHEWLGV